MSEPKSGVNSTAEMQKPGDVSLPSSDAQLAELMNQEKGVFKYSAEDFFRKPEKTAYQLSPDGQYFSFKGLHGRRQNIFVQKIGSDEKPLQLTHETERDIQGYFWANSNRIIYLKDQGGDENYSLYAINKDGTHPKDLTPYDGVKIQIIDDLKDIEDELIIGMNKNNPQLFEPYRLNILTGAIELLAKNDNPVEPISFWMTDHEGKLRIAGKVKDGVNHTLMYRDSEEEGFREIITTNFREEINPLFFEFDNGSSVFVSTNAGRDKAVITRFDMQTGEETGEIIFEHPEVDVQSLNYSRKRKVLTSVVYNTDLRHRKFFDQETAEIYQFLEDALGDYEVFITSINKEEDKMMVRTFSDRSLGAYYFFDKNTKVLKKIAEISPWLNEADMAPMKPIKYTSRDGLTINGYLTLPVGVEAKELPVVVNPHGGPWHRDVWGFNPEVQLLANRGYAVLQMNFRGSTGFGRKFWESSFKQWGKKMQDDITDGVQYLINEGIADKDYIAIYGGSYGGYATLAGLTFTPDLYACGIDYVGVSNLFSFLNTIPPYWKPYLDMMYEMVGHPERDKEHFEEASPVFHVDKIKAPLFVIQGANDPRVNIDESDQIVRSLRKRNMDVPYMVKYNEGHGFDNEENRFEVYRAMVGFLSKYLKGKA